MNKLIEKIEKRISEISELIRPVGWSKTIEVVETKAVLDIINEEAKAYNEEFNPTEDIIQYGVEGCMKEYYRRGFEDGRKTNNEVKTNADYIRNMSDEELAEFMKMFFTCEYGCGANEDGYCNDYGKCGKNILDWLKAESEG